MALLFGLLGERLDYSLSPKIHSMIMEKLQIEGCYHLFQVEKDHLEDALRGMKVLGVGGVNVTIPYKVEVMKYLHEISREAEAIGAINTISFGEGMAIGYNTDYYGLQGMFNHYGIPVKDRKVTILGTGGSAKAVVQYLKDHQVKEIILVSRYKERAQDTYQDLRVLSYREVGKVRDGDILINCTPLGMQPLDQVSPVDKEVAANYPWVIDLNYNPLQSLLLKYAKEAGGQAVNGLYMLVGQAIKSQEIWHSRTISQHILSEIYRALEHALGRKT